MSKNTWTEGQKFDSGKPAMSLLDRTALEETAAVLKFGAEKYAPHNWRKGIKFSRLTDAALRHIYAFIDGENTDHESGLTHMGHAMCCLMFLAWMVKNRPDLDDRHKTEQALSSIEHELKTAIKQAAGPRSAETKDMVSAIKDASNG